MIEDRLVHDPCDDRWHLSLTEATHMREKFLAISSHAMLAEFLREFGFQKQPSELEGSINGGLIGIYQLQTSAGTYVVRHDWYDRCRVHQIQPDGNRVSLKFSDATDLLGNYEVGVSYIED